MRSPAIVGLSYNMKCFPPGQVNFTYFPVNHVDPATGAFECEDLDCPSTRYDGCMMDGLCYGRAGGCDAATQMKIAKFLACFEGPFANTEREVNASRREPCFLEAGLDFAPVRACYEDAERADAIAARLNASKAAMMARLGPDPGYFPHIFVDGEALVNRTWCALTRSLCRAIGPAAWPPSICAAVERTLVFSVAGAFSGALQKAAGTQLDAAVARAVDVAVSEAKFPTNFYKNDDDALPAGDPSYVDVHAASSATCTVSSSGTATCRYEVLGAFAAAADDACREKSGFDAGLVFGLLDAAKIRLGASDISLVRC